tara:strand:+ start:36 stop:281 length:246 start_codon:yes stop_codon:yes gene_type:complete
LTRIAFYAYIQLYQKELKMKSKQIKNKLWKDKVVFFNGFQAKAIDVKGGKVKNDTWVKLKTKLQFLNGKTKWVDFNLVVWD